MRTVPLFVTYLVLLMHNYFLSLVSPRPGPQAQGRLSDASTNETDPQQQQPQRRRLPAGIPFVGLFVGAVSGSIGLAVAVLRHLHALCCECSLAPHCLLLHVKVRALATPRPKSHLGHLI